MNFILKNFVCGPSVYVGPIAWPYPSPLGQNHDQNGKQTLVKMARVMLVKMASKSLADWQGFVPGCVGSVGGANRIARLALTLAPVLAVLAVPTGSQGLRTMQRSNAVGWHCRSCRHFKTPI